MAELGPTEDYLLRCRARMREIDALSPDIREIVHEEGWTIVKAFLDLGIKKAPQIKHLISTVRDGSSAYGNGTRGAKDVPVLIAELATRAPYLAIVEREPTQQMVEESMKTVAGMSEIVGKYEKHHRRLRAAIAVGARKN